MSPTRHHKLSAPAKEDLRHEDKTFPAAAATTTSTPASTEPPTRKKRRLSLQPLDVQFVGTATSALLLALAPTSALAFATTSGDPTGLADDDAAAKEEAEKVRGCVCEHRHYLR
jgi:hypothetical protein